MKIALLGLFKSHSIVCIPRCTIDVSSEGPIPLSNRKGEGMSFEQSSAMGNLASKDSGDTERGEKTSKDSSFNKREKTDKETFPYLNKIHTIKRRKKTGENQSRASVYDTVKNIASWLGWTVCTMAKCTALMLQIPLILTGIVLDQREMDGIDVDSYYSESIFAGSCPMWSIFTLAPMLEFIYILILGPTPCVVLLVFRVGLNIFIIDDVRVKGYGICAILFANFSAHLAVKLTLGSVPDYF